MVLVRPIGHDEEGFLLRLYAPHSCRTLHQRIVANGSGNADAALEAVQGVGPI
jgi:hypothetical protein